MKTVMAKYKVKTRDCQLIVGVRLSLKEKINVTQLDFFSNRYIRGLLKVKMIKKSHIEYYGPIGISLYERLKKPISKYDFLFIMEQVVDTVQKLNANSLIINNVIFDIKNVFINEITKELQFIYLPLENVQKETDIIGFMEQIIYASKPQQELVVAGTSGVVEFGGDLLDQKVLQKKEDLDYTHAISNGLWSATTTLVVGGITNEISNVIHPEAKTGTMDYLFGRDKAKAVVKAQYNNARSSSSRAKYWNRLEKIKLQKTLGTIKYGIIETGKTIIDEIKNEIYRDEVNEDIVEEIDKKISCSVY